MKWKNFDLSLLGALLALFFALVFFTTEDGSALIGVFFIAFAICFILDFFDKMKLLREIAELEEELRNEKNKER